ncbi:MAG TPA: response regulator [Xanthobacteraceae bacterium]|nr:response regulator [Xanthobacteraceae bacterium]
MTLGRVFLVVDDEPAVREVAALMLEDLGCEVVTAANGSEALQRLALDARIEALITDINMPGMDGYDLAARATHLRKELKVIMLSGREMDGRGIPMVRKPFLQEDLVRAMKRTTGLC